MNNLLSVSESVGMLERLLLLTSSSSNNYTTIDDNSRYCDVIVL